MGCEIFNNLMNDNLYESEDSLDEEIRTLTELLESQCDK